MGGPERMVRRGRWVIAGYVAAGLLAMLPMLRMVGIVLDSSALQHADYWLMFPDIVTPGGGLDVDGLFVFQNEHPVVVAKLIYWLNVHLFSGSNVSLGLIDVAIVLGQLAVVVQMLRRSALDHVNRMVTIVVASVLLFSLVGTWNFAKAMSGTAWLSANLFALAAVYLRGCDRKLASGSFAVLASVSYGTGIAAWPAILATGVNRRGVRTSWKEWPYAVGLAATFVWYQTGPAGEGSRTLFSLDVAKVAASIFGYVYSSDGEFLGYIGLLVIPVVAGLMGIFSRVRGVGHWVGLSTYGFVATVIIAYGRSDFAQIFGQQNRYYSLPALGWLGFFVLVLVGARELAHRVGATAGISLRVLAGPVPAVVLAIVVLLGTVAAGRAHADDLLERDQGQELREIALRLGLTDNSAYLVGGFGRVGDITGTLIETDHYPFVDGWDLACGMLDGRIPPDEDRPRVGGRAGSATPIPLLRGGVEVTGHFNHQGPVRCILVTDRSGEVIGAATLRPTDDASGDTDDRRRFRGLARQADGYRVFVLREGDATPVRVAGEVETGTSGT